MRRIGFASCICGAGSRFFCANYACYLAKEEKRHPAVLELGSGGLYDILGMDKRFPGDGFSGQGGVPNLAAGVNWSLLRPEDEAGSYLYREPFSERGEEPEYRGKSEGTKTRGMTGDKKAGDRPTELRGSDGTGPREKSEDRNRMQTGYRRMNAERLEKFYRKLRLLDRTEGDTVLCLLDGLPEEEARLFRREMDLVFLVIDPLPSRLIRSAECLEAAGKRNDKTSFVVNKYNRGIETRQLEAFLETREYFTIPLVPGEEICRAEYACRIPYELPKIEEILAPAFSRIWRSTCGR